MQSYYLYCVLFCILKHKLLPISHQSSQAPTGLIYFLPFQKPKPNLRQMVGVLHFTQAPASLHASAYAPTAEQKHSQSPPVLQAHVSATQAS